MREEGWEGGRVRERRGERERRGRERVSGRSSYQLMKLGIVNPSVPMAIDLELNEQ